MNNIIIRPEKESDYESLFEIKRLGWLSAYSHIFSVDAINNHFKQKKLNHKNKNINTFDDGFRFVAELNGNPVATMSIATKNSDEDFIEILWLYVHPDCQRMGIGKQLYNFAKNIILCQNVKKIHIEALKENFIGCSFYSKTGGKIISTRTKEMLGKTPELVTFEFEIEPVILETERLILRNYKETDIDDYYEYVSQKEVGPRCGWEPKSDRLQALERLKLESQKPLQFAIVEKASNKVIGSIELMDTKYDRYPTEKADKQTKELGFLLSKNFWGKGYMTEAAKSVLNFAFNQLNINTLYVCHAEANTQSGRVQEKLGFKVINKTPNYRTWIDGTPTDRIERKITKSEWTKIKNTH